MASQKDVLGGGKSVAPGFGKGHGAGDFVEGDIVSVEAKQQWSFSRNGKSEPMWWDESKTEPKLQLIVTVQTDLDESRDDDGVRALYAPKGKTLARALKKALIDANADELEVGGFLSVECTGKTDVDDDYSPRGYIATYKAPKRKAQSTAQADVLNAMRGAGEREAEPTTSSTRVSRRSEREPEAEQRSTSRARKVEDTGDDVEAAPRAARRPASEDDDYLAAAGVRVD